MLTLPITEPPGPLPDIRRDYPADKNHFTAGRGGYRIEFIVLHNTEGIDSRAYLSTTSRIIDGVDYRVSIHKLIRPEAVYSIVPPANTAWHCGVTIPGYAEMNFRSLGVEVESLNRDGKCQYPYSDSDYNNLAHTVAGWMYSYAIPWERVLRHADIAAPPGRRHDPSGLDLGRLQREVYAWQRFFYALRIDARGDWII